MSEKNVEISSEKKLQIMHEKIVEYIITEKWNMLFKL